MKQFLVTLSAMCLFSMACGQTDSRAQNKTSGGSSRSAGQIKPLNRAWAEAITKGDAAALGRLFDDEIIVTSGSGEIRNKAGEIKDAAAAPDPDFVWVRPFTTEDVRIRIYNDAAVVTGLAKWTFKYKGPEVNQERRYTHLYVKRLGQWRIVAQQISANLYKKPTS